MTDAEILTKAIEKAITNGYDGLDEGWYVLPRGDGSLRIEQDGRLDQDYQRVIFNHDFAKAYFGEEYVGLHSEGTRVWQYHLQQLVLGEEPLRYLEKFL